MNALALLQQIEIHGAVARDDDVELRRRKAGFCKFVEERQDHLTLDQGFSGHGSAPRQDDRARLEAGFDGASGSQDLVALLGRQTRLWEKPARGAGGPACSGAPGAVDGQTAEPHDSLGSIAPAGFAGQCGMDWLSITAPFEVVVHCLNGECRRGAIMSK
ncbi:hypothetical protein NA2_02469 [Nitratireductor pacificus pht-3B]|uniref:Uncharacterized protein n=1 Tax=Nitratireductor pacificus pht-3B TaxID=391937 RepID=K2MTE2_9HYPH|nr:hypothetical protein NA2_02469 [Nitratireductor pacificus pht-3B]